VTTAQGDATRPENDDPISSAAEDRYGQKHIAERTAKLLVETHSWESSVVFGLVGQWGAGKSSVISMTVEALNKADSDWKVVRFTPWATGDIDGMLSEFYAAIASALPEERFANFKSGLAKVIELSAPAADRIPYVGLFAKGGLNLFKDRLISKKPWAEAFEDASDELVKLHTPLAVIADDVDRLQGDELLNFLKLVRLVGRFPGISYLLAYDERSLERTIEAASSGESKPGAARDFLEKFVQYPIYLPPLLSGLALRQIGTTLDEALAASVHTIGADDRRLGAASDVWTHLLNTPRAIKRFGAQLRTVAPLHEAGEIDIVDLTLLTLLRMHLPTVYERLPRERQHLTRRQTAGFLSQTDTSFDWQSVLGDLSDEDRKQSAKTLLSLLFPATQSPGGSTPLRPRVSHPQYFDRYFHQSIPEDDVSDYEALEALRQAAAGDHAPLSALLTTEIGDRVDTAISKLRSLSAMGGDESGLGIQNLLGAVMEHAPTLHGYKNGFFSRQDFMLGWAADLLKAHAEHLTVADIAQAIRRCSDVGLIASLLWTWSGDESPNAIAARVALIPDIRAAFLEHLGLGDDAPLDNLTVTLASFLAEFDAPATASALRKQFKKSFQADDFAARFVSTSTVIGDRRVQRLSQFHLKHFQDLAQFDDPFFTKPLIDHLNEDDVSWAARKAYAQGRAQKVAEGDA
jgi:KAP family P-loop domain